MTFCMSNRLLFSQLKIKTKLFSNIVYISMLRIRFRTLQNMYDCASLRQ